jgi:hypothetical protein
MKYNKENMRGYVYSQTSKWKCDKQRNNKFWEELTTYIPSCLK